MDKFWDFFVDTLRVIFMPLVCSYYSVSGDLFINVSVRDATGLERAGNVLLSPVQYLLAGKEAIQRSDGTWQFAQRFDYQNAFWVKTASSMIALPSSLVLGSVLKGFSLMSEPVRTRYASLKEGKIHSNLDVYRKLGIVFEQPISEVFTPQKHERRPGDEHVLALEKEAMRDITQLLNNAQIPWWVDCGTCLGAYRYGGVIPWDEDVDIAVLAPDFDNVRICLTHLDREKYIVQDWSTRDYPDSFIKVLVRATGAMVDVYHFDIHPEKKELQFIFSLDNSLFFPEWFKIRERRFKEPVAFDVVFPLKKTLFDGIEVFVPRDPQKYLQRCYGENLAPVKIYDSKTGSYEKDLSHPYWQRAYVH